MSRFGPPAIQAAPKVEIGRMIDDLGRALADPNQPAELGHRVLAALLPLRSLSGSQNQILSAVRAHLRLLDSGIRGLGLVLTPRAAVRPPGLLGQTAAVGPMTRPSCLNCVEKHLGSAYVLMAETRHGYPHRPIAIGHLQEAEDESQEYPALHNAIRDARKTIQVDGKTPDWFGLFGLLDEARGKAA